MKMRAKRNVHKNLDVGLSRIARATAFQFERIAQLQNRVRLPTNPIRQV